MTNLSIFFGRKEAEGLHESFTILVFLYLLLELSLFHLRRDPPNLLLTNLRLQSRFVSLELGILCNERANALLVHATHLDANLSLLHLHVLLSARYLLVFSTLLEINTPELEEEVRDSKPQGCGICL